MDAQVIVERMIKALESGDVDQVVPLYAEDGVQVHPLAEEPIRGRDAIRESEGTLLSAFPDVKVDLRGVYASETGVVVELTLRATNTGDLDMGDGQAIPATGRSISIPEVWAIDLDDDGLITEERAYFDTALLFRQLGLAD